MSGKTYTRCIKRYSQRVNCGKWAKLLELTRSYARQKDYFLGQYANLANISASYRFREVRNILVARQYTTPFRLQARQWKLALKDALETIDRYWASICAIWTIRILQNEHLSKEEKQYLLEGVSSRENLHLVLRFQARIVLRKMLLSERQSKRCMRFLQNLIRQTVKKSPRVQIVRSFLAEPETYRIFEHKGRQYIAIASQESGNRIVIPLTGTGKIQGQIRIVLDFEKQRIEVHHTVTSLAKANYKTAQIGIDLGITEVFTDSHNTRYGKRFGKTIQKYSDAQKDKGKKRNKLYGLAKKFRQAGNIRKARRIERNNLRRKKQAKKLARRRKELERQVNRAWNRFFNEKAPQKVMHENLNHLRGKAKSKRLSRLVSAWIRRIISDRMAFKALQRGSLLKAVNCAYSSQACPICGWVHKGNRNGDKFQCLFCRHTAESDFTAAVEIERRGSDPDISLSTPKEQVKQTLLARFRRRLESWNFPFDSSHVSWESVRNELGDKEVDAILSKLCENRKETTATVPGKTPDVSSTASQNLRRREPRSRQKKPLGERNSSSSILSRDNSADDGLDKFEIFFI